MQEEQELPESEGLGDLKKCSMLPFPTNHEIFQAPLILLLIKHLWCTYIYLIVKGQVLMYLAMGSNQNSQTNQVYEVFLFPQQHVLM